MKAGLLTFHDTNNFGSYLQTFGLYKAVRKLGCDCEVIDYQCASIVEREIPKPFKISLHPRQIVREILYERNRRKKYRKLQQFFHDNMQVGERCDIASVASVAGRYDQILVGSDIVWGLDITAGDTAYFLNFASEHTRKLAFSSSVGNPWTETEKITVKPLLERFSEIAVREDESARWVQELTGRKPVVVCDPTMLLTAKEWEHYKSDKYVGKKYVLLYFMTAEGLQLARMYARIHGLDIYYVNSGLPVCGMKNVRPTSIEDFLSLIYHARFVVTGSYHGMLFSAYFNRQFVYFNRAHKSRMDTLARRIGVTDREGLAFDINHPDIDYSKVNRAIEEFRNASMAVLQNMLQDK